MKTKLMAAVAVLAVMTATGAARADDTDVTALKAQAAALKKQNDLLEQRLNKLEQQQAAQAQKPASGNFVADAAAAPVDFLTGEKPLTFYGITVFGTIDAGLGWASYGLPTNGKLYLGDNLVNKNAHSSYFGVSPNNLGSTGVGIKGSQEILPGLSAVFMASTFVNPQSGQLANGPGSLVDNNGLNRNNYSANADGSRGGQAFNDQLYVGLSSKTYGTLTFGRQKSFATEMVGAYDPAAGAQAFSLIGYSGSYMSGLGFTENGRWDDAIKYKVEYPINGFGSVRFGAMYKFVDGNAGTNLPTGATLCTGTNIPSAGCAASSLTTAYNLKAANDAGQVTLGGSYQGLDVDGVLGYFNQAINLGGPLSSAQNLGISNFTSNYFVGNVARATNSAGNGNIGTVAGTAADTTGGAIGAKYTWNQWKFYAGWAHLIYHNPSNMVGIGAQNDQGGYVLSSVSNGAYPNARTIDTVWLGLRYAYNEKTDIVAGYYHGYQNGYGFAANTPGVSNTAANSLATCSLPAYLPYGSFGNKIGGTTWAAQTAPRSATCSGNINAASAFVDYHFTKRFDVYGGLMFSGVDGGLQSGFVSATNWAPTLGARFTF